MTDPRMYEGQQPGPEPCGCDESVGLHAEVQQLRDALAYCVGPAAGGPGNIRALAMSATDDLRGEVERVTKEQETMVDGDYASLLVEDRDDGWQLAERLRPVVDAACAVQELMSDVQFLIAAEVTIPGQHLHVFSLLCDRVRAYRAAGSAPAATTQFPPPNCKGCEGPDCEGCQQSPHWYWFENKPKDPPGPKPAGETEPVDVTWCPGCQEEPGFLTYEETCDGCGSEVTSTREMAVTLREYGYRVTPAEFEGAVGDFRGVLTGQPPASDTGLREAAREAADELERTAHHSCAGLIARLRAALTEDPGAEKGE